VFDDAEDEPSPALPHVEMRKSTKALANLTVRGPTSVLPGFFNKSSITRRVGKVERKQRIDSVLEE
jgi:hypothetical protein